MTRSLTEARQSIAVFGAGSWGTALAIQLCRAGQQTQLWGRDAAHLSQIQSAGRNERYLPDAGFQSGLTVEPSLEAIVRGHRDLLVCVPSHAFRLLLSQIKPFINESHRVAWATKGFEQTSGKLPHQVAEEILGKKLPLAVLSGPTFATEVGAGLPTAMTVAANQPAFALELAERLSDQQFRAYTSNDLIGVETGGAVKNVLAIAAGISDGLGFGANTRIALITRGLVEMTRLGIALGAEEQTFMGLSGMGDLVLTCTDNQSRNRRMGLALAAGKCVDEAADEIGQVVEGVYAARAVREVAEQYEVEMPICEQVYKVLYEKAAPEESVQALMSRALKPE